MNQYEGFSFSFDDIEDGVALDVNGLGRKGGIPVNPSRPNERNTTPTQQESQQNRDNPSGMNHVSLTIDH
jgi:hypothetical protein